MSLLDSPGRIQALFVEIAIRLKGLLQPVEAVLIMQVPLMVLHSVFLTQTLKFNPRDPS